MIGWEIQVLKQPDGGHAPSTMESPKGTLLAAWTIAGISGISWLDNLANEGKAIALGGDGYPIRFTATAENLLPRIFEERIDAISGQLCDGLQIHAHDWKSQTVTDLLAAANCRPGEWLLVEAWDQS